MYQITFSGSPQGAANEVYKRAGQIEFCIVDGKLTCIFGGKEEERYTYENGQWTQPETRVGYTDILIADCV